MKEKETVYFFLSGIFLFLLAGSSLWAGAGVKIQQVLPEKLINRKNSAALITATLINGADTDRKIRLVCELVTGLDDTEVLYDGKVLVPGGDIINFPVKFNTGNREWGTLARVTLLDNNNKKVARAEEVFGISDNFYKISPVHTFLHGSRDIGPERMKEIAAERRKIYWPLVEYSGAGQTSWALNQWGMGIERWVAGGIYPETRQGLMTFIRSAHQQGLGVVFYNIPAVCGPAGTDFSREHPEWLAYAGGRPVYRYLSVESMEKLRNPEVDDKSRESFYSGVRTYTPVLFTDQSVMDFAVDQIIQVSRYYDFDGIRWDGYPMLMPRATVENGVDVAGDTNYRGVPMDRGISDLDEWNEKNITRMNKRIKEVLPDFIFGTNWSPEYQGICWSKKMPATYRTCARDGMVMDEDLQTKDQEGSANPENLWETYRQRVVRGADLIREAGGYDSVTKLAAGSPVFNRHLVSIIYAGGASLGIYSGSEQRFAQAKDFYRFALRYSEFLYSHGFQRIKDLEQKPVLKVESDKTVWWKEYVYQGKLDNGKGCLFVNLVNPPVKPYLDYTETEKPEERNGIDVVVDQGIAGKVKKAYLLSPEMPGYTTDLKMETYENKVRVAIPKLGFWGMVVFETE
ncbi:MAG: glycoside hydrolase family 66 protein [Candidatus Omnitrophota bacterium]